jgi:hypothetical protein
MDGADLYLVLTLIDQRILHCMLQSLKAKLLFYPKKCVLLPALGTSNLSSWAN